MSGILHKICPGVEWSFGVINFEWIGVITWLFIFRFKGASDLASWKTRWWNYFLSLAKSLPSTKVFNAHFHESHFMNHAWLNKRLIIMQSKQFYNQDCYLDSNLLWKKIPTTNYQKINTHNSFISRLNNFGNRWNIEIVHNLVTL